MAYSYPIHEDDAAELGHLREQLIKVRQATGRTGRDLSLAAGQSPEFLHRMERGRREGPLMSTLQMWASVLDHRIEFELEHFWVHAHSDGEMLMWFARSRAWGADEWQRQWLVSALGVWRVKSVLDVAVVADRLGVSSSGLRDWESQSSDPLVRRAMLLARAMGTRVQLRLWRRADWRFDR